uniref:Uncharacterized protein n=1 Tax=Suricata suricatta TaxID=37032 RepID=A0A673USU3_SURSU
MAFLWAVFICIYEGQDFVVLRRRCLAQKCLFEDRVFPAGVQALGSHDLFYAFS